MIPIKPLTTAVEAKKCIACHAGKTLPFEFEYAYQPIVDVTKRTIYAHEALVRGPNGESAYSVLSQVNEENRYLFDQSRRTKAIAGAAKLGMKELLSINFLPNAVYRPELCIRSTFEAAKEHNFPINQIIFEVTEGEKVEDRPHLVNIFKEYRKFGFLTAIDDFGAGYSGLQLLAEYQPDIIKIDMDLVRNIDTDSARQAISKAIVSMCKDLGVRVLAEGVETKAERDYFISIGVDLMQGCWFSKPVFQGLGLIKKEAWL